MPGWTTRRIAIFRTGLSLSNLHLFGKKSINPNYFSVQYDKDERGEISQTKLMSVIYVPLTDLNGTARWLQSCCTVVWLIYLHISSFVLNLNCIISSECRIWLCNTVPLSIPLPSLKSIFYFVVLIVQFLKRYRTFVRFISIFTAVMQI